MTEVMRVLLAGLDDQQKTLRRRKSAFQTLEAMPPLPEVESDMADACRRIARLEQDIGVTWRAIEAERAAHEHAVTRTR